jgi:periplasmic protein TonB
MLKSLLGFTCSLLIHGVILGAVAFVVVKPKTQAEFQKVTVREIPKPPPPVPVVEDKKPEPPPPPPPPKVRKPKVREDKRVEPAKAPQPVQEVRAGLSDSLAAPGKSSGPAVAQGNSAEVSVNPSDANKPPPAPVFEAEVTDPNAAPVSEAAADVPAKCATIGEIQLTEDAVNAGVTTGKVLVEAVIGFDGSVIKVQIKKGTGYDVDKLVLDRVSKMRCTPAKQSGKNVAQRRRFELIISL